MGRGLSLLAVLSAMSPGHALAADRECIEAGNDAAYLYARPFAAVPGGMPEPVVAACCRDAELRKAACDSSIGRHSLRL